MALTKEQLLDKLRQCFEDDPVASHVQADQALLEYIGDDDVSDAFHAIEKWYE
jgi:hypothetical protein